MPSPKKLDVYRFHLNHQEVRYEEQNIGSIRSKVRELDICVSTDMQAILSYNFQALRRM